MASSEDFRLTLPYMFEDLPATLPTREQISLQMGLEDCGSSVERHIMRVGEH
jgi:hypothetical protein